MVYFSPSIRRQVKQRAYMKRKEKEWIARGDYSIRVWFFVLIVAFSIFSEAVHRARAYIPDIWPIDQGRFISHGLFWFIPFAVLAMLYFYKSKLPNWLKLYVKCAIALLIPAYFVFMFFDTAQSKSAVSIGNPYWASIVRMEGCRKGGKKSNLFDDCENFHQKVEVTDYQGRITFAYRYAGLIAPQCALVQKIGSKYGAQWFKIIEIEDLQLEYDYWGRTSVTMQDAMVHCRYRPVS